MKVLKGSNGIKCNIGVLIVGSAIIFSGCATTSSKQNSVDYGLTLPDTPNALQIISQESQKALNAQKMLVAYRQQYSDTLDYRQKNFTIDKLKVDYIGKPVPLLNSLAIKYGYRFIEYGVKSDLPTVNYNDYWGTPESILISLSSQLDNAASISIDKEQKVITLIYPTN